MNVVPNSLSRVVNRSLLKINKNSPTILVVAGVVGLGATAVMAAKATRRIDPIISNHYADRTKAKRLATNPRDEQRKLVAVYANTGKDLARLYGPTLVVGTVSAASVLYGHRVLRVRQFATMLAYSGLQEQFMAYRKRIVRTLGEDTEREIYNGAHAEWQEDPDHKGEYKLKPVYELDQQDQSYLRPFFDETNVNWTKDPQSNYLFLKGVQQHMNNMLQIRGHVFLNDVLDSLRMPRCREGAITGWLWHRDGGGEGDNYIDFGFMTSTDPIAVAFRNGFERSVRLNFNIDGVIFDKI